MEVSEALRALAAEGLSPDALFALARDKSAGGRQALFETVRDLFLDTGPTVSERERALMGEIIRHLVHDLEMALRRDLAERLAERADTPRALIVQLANDDYQIAHPVLLRSQVLLDPDLIEIVKHRTLDHQLAVSQRKTLSESVSKVLVDTGQEDVISCLLKNHGAKISRQVMEFLVDESRRVDSYQDPLVRRPDLPPELARRMYWWVSAALRKHIAGQFELDRDILDDAIVDAAANQLNKIDPAPESKAEQLVGRLADLGELTPDILVKTLNQGEISLFVAAFCEMAGLKPKLMRRILYEPGGEALALLCRALDIELNTFVTIFQLSRRAKDGAAAPTAEQERDLVQLYTTTQQEDAGRILKRWRRSSDYLSALKQLSADGCGQAGRR
jgi:uncharacterized protein (DUF2336 family)